MPFALERLVIGDDPRSWKAAGFTVEGNTVALGRLTVELAGSDGERGLLSWKLNDIEVDIDGLATTPDTEWSAVEVVRANGVRNHINAVFGIDHVVIETGNIARTVAAFEHVGIVERRSSVLETPRGPRKQSFLWAGRVILEVVGPPEPDEQVATKVWGLALVTSNLQTTGHVLDQNLSEPRDAVQPGRKIATVRTADLDISVPLVVLSPHVSELM